VIVPCSIPVGACFKPAASAAAITACGSSGVAMSMSRILRPSNPSRTQPPTKRGLPPARSSA